MTSAAGARSFVRTRCAAWELPAEVVEDALVVVTELVGNALRYAATPLVVALALEPSTLTIAVTDGDSALPEPRVPDVHSEGSRGLQLVALLARSWGADFSAVGKVVWAKLDRPRAL